MESSEKIFSAEDAKNYVKKLGKSKYFYFNIYGWNCFYTLKPTASTPTGKAVGFPRRKLFKF